MRQLRPGSKQTIRGINRALVMHLVRRHGALSRVQIAERSSLAQPTVSEIVGDLLEKGFLVETSAVVSERRGPRPVLLEINPRGGFALGGMLRPDGLNLVLTDLTASVLARSYHPFPAGCSARAMLGHVAEWTREAVAGAGVAWSDVQGLGLGMTGVIDSSAGMCRDAYILGWSDVPVGAILQAELDLPVLVDNDTRTLTVAERHVGLGRGHEHFALVTVGRGVGMGVVVGGELLRGHQDIGVEFGHLTMELGGPPCPCGKRGCLEAIASDVGIMRAAREAGLAEPGETVEALTGRALAGDERLSPLFWRAGTMLGVAVAHVINLFGPSLLVLTGEGLRAGPLLLEPVRAALPGCVFRDRLQRTELAVKPWDPDWEPWALGAACLVLEDMFRPRLYHSGEGAAAQAG